MGNMLPPVGVKAVVRSMVGIAARSMRIEEDASECITWGGADAMNGIPTDGRFYGKRDEP